MLRFSCSYGIFKQIQGLQHEYLVKNGQYATIVLKYTKIKQITVEI